MSPARLPFTHSEFLGVFEKYNQDVWPFAAALWLGALVTLVRWVRSNHTDNRPLFTFLAILWAWSALVYFLGFFRTISPAAWLFAALFMTQSALFVRLALSPRGTSFLGKRSFRRRLATLLGIYGLSYPFLGLVLGMEYPRMPTFGVPCPTMVLTASVLLCAEPRAPRSLTIVPLFWSVVGGSAAFLFGMVQDFALILSGVLLIVLETLKPGQRPWKPEIELGGNSASLGRSR